MCLFHKPLKRLLERDLLFKESHVLYSACDKLKRNYFSVSCIMWGKHASDCCPF